MVFFYHNLFPTGLRSLPMKITWKKAIALALALCAVLGMMLPAAGDVHAVSTASDLSYQQYLDRGYGPVTDLGIALHGDMQFTDHSALLSYNNEQYLLAPAKGGVFFVFRLSEFLRSDNQSVGNWIYDEVDIGGGFEGIACDSYGITYISNGGNSIYVYDISKKGQLETINVGHSVQQIVIDENNNLFVTTGDCKVIKISKIYGQYEITELSDLSGEVTYLSGIAYGGGRVYVSGNKNLKADNIAGSYIYQIVPYISSKSYEYRYYHSAKGGFVYLSYASGLVFAANTGHCGSMVVLNASDLSSTAIPMKLRILNTDANGNKLDSSNSAKYLELTDAKYQTYYEQYYQECYSGMSIIGMVTDARNGYVYFLTADTYDGIDSNTDADQMNKGFWRFNISAWSSGNPEPAEHVGSFNSKGIDSKNTALRVRNPYVTVTDSETGDTSTYIFTTAPATPYLWCIENSNPNNSVYAPTGTALKTLLNDAYTIAVTRSISTGIGSTAAYVGGYLTPVVASYSPTNSTPLDTNLFSSGHAQTDSMIVYKNKLYCGAYNGAYLVQYDPNAEADQQRVDLIPGGLKPAYGQARIHALAAGDDKIFFSTIPDDQRLGGIVGYFDLAGFGEEGDTKTLSQRLVILGELVPQQSIICLVYDEQADILYGSSSKYGGTSSGVDSNKNGVADHLEDPNTEAMIMVYDVAAGQHKGNFSITGMQLLSASSPTFPASKPWYIDGIGQDPVSRKLWGVVDQTIFSFSYDEETGAFSAVEEISGRKSNYVPQGNPNWFPRPIIFDGMGNVYIELFAKDVYRYTLDANNKLTDATSMGMDTRCYTLGADGNLYLIRFHGENLWRVSLQPHSIVEDLIDQASAEDAVSVANALAAYNTLDESSQALVSTRSYNRLQALQDNQCKIEQDGNTTYSSVANALATAAPNTTITLLVDYIGNITLSNNITMDLGGNSVTGNVTVTNGTLDLNGGSITGDLAVISGTVKDTTDGTGFVSGTVALQQDNGQYLPLLNGTVTRFFYYKARSLAVAPDELNPEQLNFWFDLEFTNTNAYDLIASGSASNLDIWARVCVNGRQIGADVVFDAKLRGWAAEDHTGEDNWALYVGVVNIPDAGVTITIKPYLSANGIRVSFDDLSRKVGPVTAEAFFAAWPVDLIK